MARIAKRWAIILVITAIGAGIAWQAAGSSVQLMGISGLLWCAIIAYGIQWLAAIPAIIGKTEKYFDLVGSLTYITTICFGLYLASLRGSISIVQWVTAGLVFIWALRLGTFLFRRIHKAGKDDRFIQIKQEATRFLITWTLQGLWVFLTALAAFVILTQRQSQDQLSPIVLTGWTLWLLGFAIEAIADAQKSTFNAKPENKGRWVDVGLWRYSQHPNYFGEILLWTGICVSGMGLYQGPQWLAVLSPIFVFLLLTKVSGIPLLDKRAAQKWGDDPAYKAYCESTNVLVIGPRRS